jgi:DNA replication protein DnaC
MTASSKFGSTPIQRQSHCDIHNTDYTEEGIKMTFVKREVWKGCPLCKAEEVATQEEKMLRVNSIKKQRAYEESIMMAGIPTRYRQKSFENFIIENTYQQKSYDAMLRVRNDLAEKNNYDDMVILSGGFGTGKTHLASAIANSLIGKKTVFFTDVNSLVRSIRDTWRKESDRTTKEIYETLANVDLLIIDEFGVNQGTDDETLIFFNIMNDRYSNKKPVMIITNLSLLDAAIMMGPRTYDRFKECGILIEFEGNSFRPKAAEMNELNVPQELQ